MEKKEKINPFRVMVNPRGFIRALKEKKRSSGWILAGMTGLVWLFEKAYSFYIGNYLNVSWIVLLAVILAIPVGFALVYLGAFVLYWTGKIFNGKASYEDVYQAYLRTEVTQLFMIVSWIGLIGVYGQFAFIPALIMGNALPVVVMALIGMQVIFKFWQAIILFHTLGEVQGCSAWVMIWNVLISWGILLVIDNIFDWIIAKSFMLESLAVRAFLHL
jgi:hypothetical protein